MKSGRPSIRAMAIAIAAAMMVVLGVIGMMLIQRVQDQMADAAKQNLAGYAHVIALAHTQWVAESESLLAALASMVRGGTLAPDRCTATLGELLENSVGYDTFLIADANGRVRCSPLPLTKPISLADRAYFREALETGRFSVGSYILGRVSGLHALPLAYPVTGPDGSADFVIVAGKRLSWFGRLVAGLNLPDGTEVTLVDPDGGVMASFPSFDSPEEVGRVLTPLIRDAAVSGRPHIVSGMGVDGAMRIHAYTPVERAKIGIVVSQRDDVVLGGAYEFRWQAIGMLALSLVAGIAGALLLLRRMVVVPLAKLVQGTRAIRSGDLSWRADTVPAGSAEFAELCASFDAMVDELARHQELIHTQAAELARSNADLQYFAYTVSHDLREPLRTVASFVKLIERRYGDKLDAEGLEFMAYVTDGAERMSRMLDGVLEYSRIESRGGLPEPVPLDEPIDNALRALALRIEENGARVERSPMPIIMGNIEQLSRLFQNLIANAIKFRNPDQPPVIRISAVQRGSLWEIAVSDNGMGLPAEGRDQLFQLFRRLVTREQVPGDGVGLAVCKRIVERHGGTIRVESEPGQGATFLFTLVGAPASAPA